MEGLVEDMMDVSMNEIALDWTCLRGKQCLDCVLHIRKVEFCGLASLRLKQLRFKVFVVLRNTVDELHVEWLIVWSRLTRANYCSTTLLLQHLHKYTFLRPPPCTRKNKQIGTYPTVAPQSPVLWHWHDRPNVSCTAS